MFISFIYASLHGLVKQKACQQGSRDPFGPGHSVRFAKVGLVPFNRSPCFLIKRWSCSMMLFKQCRPCRLGVGFDSEALGASWIGGRLRRVSGKENLERRALIRLSA